MGRTLPSLLLVALALQSLLPLAIGEGPPGPEVVISEVHPWPASDGASEFVELHVPVTAGGVASLRGWTLTDSDGAPELVLGRVTMEPGAYLVIWNCPRPIGAKGLSCRREAPTWNNDGDDVTLLDAQGRVRAHLAYGSGDAVDPAPDGWVDGGIAAPAKGMSISLDPVSGECVEAPPTPGRAGPANHAALDAVPPSGMEGQLFWATSCATVADPPVVPSLLMAAVHPGGGPDWETVVLENRGDGAVPLDGMTLTDGEGTWALPEGSAIRSHARASVAWNATAHSVLWGRPPDLVATPEGQFALADAGDEVSVLGPSGEVLDRVAFGDADGGCGLGWSGPPVGCPARMPWGRLIARCPGPDTDTARDWSCSAMCGWLDPGGPDVPLDARAACFVTPGEGFDALVGAISSARERISAAVYWLTSAEVASALAQRARSGVEVELLVEDRPVGASTDELARRDSLLLALVEAGVRVRMTFGTDEGVRLQPYAFHHAKYAVLDGRTIVVTTENWVTSSFPAPGQGSEGLTRGWGAVVECPALASELERVHRHDVERASIPWDGEDLQVRGASLPVCTARPSPTLLPARAGLLFGPEGWGEGLSGILGVIGEANASLDLELSELEVEWSDAPSPLVNALLGAAARGVRVRVLVDGGVGSLGEGTVDGLQRSAARAGATGLRAAVARGLEGASRLHAKGLVADGRRVLLGSMNWVQASVLRNREVDVLLDCPPAASRLSSAFDADWNASVVAAPPGPPAVVMASLLEGWSPVPSPLPEGPPPTADGGPFDALAGVPRAAAFIAICLAAWGLERRYRPFALVRARLGRTWPWTTAAVRGAVRLRQTPTGAPPPTRAPVPPTAGPGSRGAGGS